ncbi:Asp23/Gls24 family envelope stress response protein [Parageobacillus toebii NBRC 107807]|uniref:Alkaline shock family protein YloU n=1 Tax=Parageobacillus toebii NBRC 107807 TaxID=1223503 RepID=A0A6G9J2R1_9BACL|nr:Asp23/Gls24 family envelope stress response protein [Parageobacillus toebii]MBB3868014.1 putative alkaline shock family protein YloU [Parageobacillus toebii NBRC 107807]MED4968708.1 Asp23/Gls24 family envelope stress response protein [Parageobacillus toebii]QIQ33003.1 Asp23/Gls24 family envelope stress response protein [Parageobacillus toebii NBRC 107807]QSB48320.1 Asp23/Gls24 family envelope stress response protein [Parageobacillus toebii]
MKTIVRFRKLSATQATLLTIVMMCLKDLNDIVIDDCEVHVTIEEDCLCTVTALIVIKRGVPIISLCEQLQKHITEEIEAMTPFTVDKVHVVVKHLAM